MKSNPQDGDGFFLASDLGARLFIEPLARPVPAPLTGAHLDEARYAGRGNFYGPTNPFDPPLASPFEKPIL